MDIQPFVELFRCLPKKAAITLGGIAAFALVLVGVVAGSFVWATTRTSESRITVLEVRQQAQDESMRVLIDKLDKRMERIENILMNYARHSR